MFCFSDGFTSPWKTFTRLTNFVVQKKNYSTEYHIKWIYEDYEESLVHDRGLLIKEPIFQFIKKNLNAWISARLGHIKKLNFRKCHTRDITKKRWQDSQHEQLFPWLLPPVLFPPDLYLFLQLISNYLPPLTLKLWDLPRDILKFIIFVNIQLVLTEVFLEK